MVYIFKDLYKQPAKEETIQQKNTDLTNIIKQSVKKLPKHQNDDKYILNPYITELIKQRTELKNKENKTSTEKKLLSKLYRKRKKYIRANKNIALE